MNQNQSDRYQQSQGSNYDRKGINPQYHKGRGYNNMVFGANELQDRPVKRMPSQDHLDVSNIGHNSRSNNDVQSAGVFSGTGRQLGSKRSTGRNKEQPMSDLTKRNLVITLCGIAFMSNSAFSQMSPFYPLKAKEKGVTIIYVGFVMGVMAGFQIITSFLVGKYLHNFSNQDTGSGVGRHHIIMMGCLLIIIQTASLGYLQWVDDSDQFLQLSFMAQILGGIGAGANSTASMAVLSSFRTDEREQYIGWIESATGIGLLFGPLLGALLYNIGDYYLPFFFFSVLYAIAFPTIVFILHKSNAEATEYQIRMAQIRSQQSDMLSNPDKKAIPFWKLIVKPRFFFGLLAQMNIMMSLQYLAPVLSLHLRNFGYTPTAIGVAYGIPAILYAATCPFIYILTQKIQKRGTIVIGFVLISIGMLMIGGSDAFDSEDLPLDVNFRKQPVYVFIGLCIVGISAGMVSIPVLPEMLECIEEDEALNETYDQNSIENFISGLFISFQSLGEALGPIISSYLSDYYGFQVSQELYCCYLTCYFVLYFLLCGMCIMCTSPAPHYRTTGSKSNEEAQDLIKIENRNYAYNSNQSPRSQIV